MSGNCTWNPSSDRNGSHMELRLGAKAWKSTIRSAEARRGHCGEAIYRLAGPERRLAEDRQAGENLWRARVHNTRQGRSGGIVILIGVTAIRGYSDTLSLGTQHGK